AFAIFGALMVVTLRRRRSASRSGSQATAQRRRGELWPWIAAISVLAVWEIATYFAGFGGHRQSFPTVSSLYDEAARWRGAKAAAYFLWLALGWGLVRR
ncbi:MAG TPA: hypothetical protein VE197_08800, partial [Mycobacterium sp.]|nr:hypothetical protein [Mycobacterium sp.]